MTNLRTLLTETANLVADYRDAVSDHRVAPEIDVDRFRATFGGPFSAEGVDAATAIEELVAAVEPVLTASSGPRYFGFVTGGSLDAAVCADLLTTGWDQVGFNAVMSPAAALVEEVAGVWLKEALGLPADASFGIVTGAQGGNTVGLAAARHQVLERAGWDVERDGLHGAPRIRVVAGEERHASIDRSLRFLGIGTASVEAIASDVVLNQVLVGFGDDERTERVIEGIQRDGTCWMGGTTWHGRRLMRISVSNWTTTEADVTRSVEAIRRVLASTM